MKRITGATGDCLKQQQRCSEMHTLQSMRLKLEPGQDDKVLSEVITEAVLNLLDTWSESVEGPLVQRAKEIFSWFLREGREESPPVPLSTCPCAYEDAEEFYSLEN